MTYIASQNPMSLSNGSAVWSILAQFNSFNDLSTFLALNWFYSIIALYSLFCTSYQPETVACMHKELINKTSKHNINFPMIFMGKWHHPCTKKYTESPRLMQPYVSTYWVHPPKNSGIGIKSPNIFTRKVGIG